MKTLAEEELGFFKPDPNQPRKEFDIAELTLLEESLFIRQESPLTTFFTGVIIDGERRWRAAQLKGRIKKLWVVKTDEPMTPSEVMVSQISSAVHRSDLTAFEKWQACVKLMEMNPWQMKDLAANLAITPSAATHLMSPSKTLPAVQEAFRAGAINLSQVYAISKVSDGEQHAMLAAALNGAGKEQLEHVGRRARNPVVAEKVSKIKCAMEGGVVQITGKDIDLEAAIEIAQAWVKRARKAVESGWNAKTLEAACKAEAGGA